METFICGPDFNAKEVIQFSKIFEWEEFIENWYEVVKFKFLTSNHYYVINIDKKKNGWGGRELEKQRIVSFRGE